MMNRGLHFHVQRGALFDVIWPGGEDVGETAKERGRNHFPRLVCTTESKDDAELICDALDELLGLVPE